MKRTPLTLIVALVLALVTPALAAPICPPCDPEIPILVEVPLEGRNYAGPTKYEGDIYNAFGKTYTVEIVIDGTLKPVVALSVLNPGLKQFIRWTTAALSLARGPHVMVITITDLAQPTCPEILTIHFATR